jgi:hypothetical protein
MTRILPIRLPFCLALKEPNGDNFALKLEQAVAMLTAPMALVVAVAVRPAGVMAAMAFTSVAGSQRGRYG